MFFCAAEDLGETRSAVISPRGEEQKALQPADHNRIDSLTCKAATYVYARNVPSGETEIFLRQCVYVIYGTTFL